eukprot:SM000093S24424  [mRNA]  locus=s93:195063:198358:- [translate_table: standard]
MLRGFRVQPRPRYAAEGPSRSHWTCAGDLLVSNPLDVLQLHSEPAVGTPMARPRQHSSPHVSARPSGRPSLRITLGSSKPASELSFLQIFAPEEVGPVVDTLQGPPQAFPEPEELQALSASEPFPEAVVSVFTRDIGQELYSEQAVEEAEEEEVAASVVGGQQEQPGPSSTPETSFYLRGAAEAPRADSSTSDQWPAGLPIVSEQLEAAVATVLSAAEPSQAAAGTEELTSPVGRGKKRPAEEAKPPLPPPILVEEDEEAFDFGGEAGSEATTSGGSGGSAGPSGRQSKKSRLVWTAELHSRFMNAVNHLGVKHAVPKTILQLMNVEGMTRENVASHLQKYRLYLKRLSGISPSVRLSGDIMHGSGSGPLLHGGGGHIMGHQMYPYMQPGSQEYPPAMMMPMQPVHAGHQMVHRMHSLQSVQPMPAYLGVPPGGDAAGSSMPMYMPMQPNMSMQPGMQLHQPAMVPQYLPLPFSTAAARRPPTSGGAVPQQPLVGNRQPESGPPPPQQQDAIAGYSHGSVAPPSAPGYPFSSYSEIGVPHATFSQPLYQYGAPVRQPWEGVPYVGPSTQPLGHLTGGGSSSSYRPGGNSAGTSGNSSGTSGDGGGNDLQGSLN